MKIVYSMPDEKIVALAYAELLHDPVAKRILDQEFVESREEAIHLSKFLLQMADQSSHSGASPTCELSAEFWIEKLYDSIGNYLKKAGYAAEWGEEVNK